MDATPANYSPSANVLWAVNGMGLSLGIFSAVLTSADVDTGDGGCDAVCICVRCRVLFVTI